MFHHPFGKYWRKKADEWMSLIVRSIGYCQKCEKRGTYEQKSTTHTGGLVNHHLLEKSVYLAYRYLRLNGICLCADCHTASPESPDKPLVNGTNAFLKWLEEHFREQYEWMQAAKEINPTIQMNYKKIAEQLKAEYMKLMETHWMDLEVQDVPQGRQI